MRTRLPAVFLAAAVLVAPACARRDFTRNIGDINEDPRQTPAVIVLSDAQIYGREALVDDRRREADFLRRKLLASENQKFEPAVRRQLRNVTTLAAQLAVQFNPAAGVTAGQAADVAALENQIQLTRLRTQLLAAQQELADFQSSPGNAGTPSGSAPSNQPPPGPGGPSSGAPDVDKLEKLTADLADRLEKALGDGSEIRKAAGDASPREQFRDLQAYRAELRGALDQVYLDDVHDRDGNSLYRLQLRATIMPGRQKDKFGVARLTVHPPKLAWEDVEQLYRSWLAHITYRVNHAGPDAARETLYSFGSRFFDLVFVEFAFDGRDAELCKSRKQQVALGGQKDRCGGVFVAVPPELADPMEKLLNVDKATKAEPLHVYGTFDYEEELRPERSNPRSIVESCVRLDEAVRNSDDAAILVASLDGYAHRLGIEGSERTLRALRKRLALSNLNKILGVLPFSLEDLENHLLLCEDWIEPLSRDEKRRLVVSSNEGAELGKGDLVLSVRLRSLDRLGSLEASDLPDESVKVDLKDRDQWRKWFLLASWLDGRSDHEFERIADEERSTVQAYWKRLLKERCDEKGCSSDPQRAGRTAAEIIEGNATNEEKKWLSGSIASLRAFIKNTTPKQRGYLSKQNTWKPSRRLRQWAFSQRLVGLTNVNTRRNVRWEPCETRGEAFVYTSSPAELGQRSSMISDAADALRLAGRVSALVPLQGVSADAGASQLDYAVGQAEAIERTPIVVGFAGREHPKETAATGSEGRACARFPQQTIAPWPRRGKQPGRDFGRLDPFPKTRPQFGWVFGPRIFIEHDGEKSDLALRQTLRSQPVSVDLSLPGWWPWVDLEVESAWVGNWYEGCCESGEVIRKMQGQERTLRVALPLNRADLDALTSYLLSRDLGEVARRARIDHVQPRAVGGCGTATFLIYGRDVWRSSKAYLAGLPATSIQVLPDMEGVAASFDLKSLPRPLPSEEVDLTVWTRNGSDSWSVGIKGAKAAKCAT